MTNDHHPVTNIDITGPMRVTAAGLLTSAALAAIKIVTGIAGSCYALIADGIESLADVVTSFIVMAGLWVSVRPPDSDHPYGHGRAETFAGLLVAGALFIAAGVIVFQSIIEIRTSHSAPAWFTLPVLVGVVGVKLFISRRIGQTGRAHESSAMLSDAWHHASDALTSAAAFVGISIALIGGPGWESADDWAALLACGVIVWNAARLLRGSLNELMDASVAAETEEELRAVAAGVPGVAGVEKCRIRKSGLGLLMDIHIEVDPEMPVREGHKIAHDVVDALIDSPHTVVDVIVHVEPAGGVKRRGAGKAK